MDQTDRLSVLTDVALKSFGFYSGLDSRQRDVLEPLKSTVETAANQTAKQLGVNCKIIYSLLVKHFNDRIISTYSFEKCIQSQYGLDADEKVCKIIGNEQNEKREGNT